MLSVSNVVLVAESEGAFDGNNGIDHNDNGHTSFTGSGVYNVEVAVRGGVVGAGVTHDDEDKTDQHEGGNYALVDGSDDGRAAGLDRVENAAEQTMHHEDEW